MKVVIVVLMIIGIAGALMLVGHQQEKEALKPISIKKINGIGVDSNAKHQGLFLAGSVHEVEYEFSNPENGDYRV